MKHFCNHAYCIQFIILLNKIKIIKIICNFYIVVSFLKFIFRSSKFIKFNFQSYLNKSIDLNCLNNIYISNSAEVFSFLFFLKKNVSKMAYTTNINFACNLKCTFLSCIAANQSCKNYEFGYVDSIVILACSIYNNAGTSVLLSNR